MTMNQEAKRREPRDVISFLKGQHKRIKTLFARVIEAEGDERATVFVELQDLLAAHEEAEEEVVHPAAERRLANGPAEVRAREKEEAEAKEALSMLAGLDVDSSDFDTQIRKLEKAVLAHAKSEENEEFDKLADKLDESELQRMRTTVQVVEAQASVSAEKARAQREVHRSR
jgi:hemerythrin superfamily protein